MPSHKNAVVVYQRKRFLSIDSMESIEVVEDTGERTKVGYTGTGSEDRPIVLSGVSYSLFESDQRTSLRLTFRDNQSAEMSGLRAAIQLS